MNEKAHWDRIGSGYDDEIFDVFRSDRNQVLRKLFSQLAQPDHTAIDFGCGTGKAFPYLSPAFKRVTGYDISVELLKVAKTRAYDNVTLKQADLTSPNLRFEAADFLFCCNVIMLPKTEMNQAMLTNVYKALRKGGNAVIVVPSLESILYTSWRMIQWYNKEGVKLDKISETEFDYYAASKRRIVEGIIHIDGVPTMHYTEPELQVLFADAKLSITAVERVEYDWTSEFSEPPKWMKAPYPWDWLVTCRKD